MQSYTNKQLDTIAKRGNPFAMIALEERQTVAKLSVRVEKAERAERDAQHEIDKLRRKIAELESIPK